MIGIFDKFATDFRGAGIAVLKDCISATITEVLNGQYTLEIEYPNNGQNYGLIEVDSVIKANGQLFTVETINKGFTTSIIECDHISYRLSGIPIIPHSASSLSAAVSGIASNCVLNDSSGFANVTGFNIEAIGSASATYSIDTPKSARACIGEMISTFGVDVIWDNFNVYLVNKRGQDNNLTIRYANNMTSLSHETKQSANGLYYYYKNGDDSVYPTRSGESETGHPYKWFEIKDATVFYDEKPTRDKLVADAQSASESLTWPAVAIDVSFVELGKLAESTELSGVGAVALGDTVRVVHQKLGISYKSRIVKTVYDCLRNTYDSVSVGTVQTTLADTIADSLGGNTTIYQGGGGGGEKGDPGVGVQSVVQTTTSTADSGTNVVTVTLTNGETSTFNVRNGSKGSKGDTGAQGPQGEAGESTAAAVYAVYTGSGTASLTAGTITQATLSSLIAKDSSSILSLSSDGGIRVNQTGAYRVSGSVYISITSGTTAKGCYIKVGSSFSSASEVNAVLEGGAISGGVAVGEKILNLSAGDIVYLGGRTMSAGGTMALGGGATFLCIEKVVGKTTEGGGLTAEEVQALIDEAIGGVENGTY